MTDNTAASERLVLRTVYIQPEMDNWMYRMAYTRGVTKNAVLRALIEDALTSRAKDAPFMAELPLPKPENMLLRTVYLPQNTDKILRKIAQDTGIAKNQILRVLLREGRALSAQRGELTIGEMLEARAAKLQAEKKPPRRASPGK